jgi:hypothetical protein
MSTATSIGTVHLRRALLLFAIVLGTAALAASLSRPVEDRPDSSDPPSQTSPEAAPGAAAPPPSSEPAEPISFDAARDESRRLRAGQAATLEIAVAEPGNVEIPDLGLSAPADSLTPARFEVLPSRAGNYEIVFRPAAGDAGEPAGRLVVRSAG